MASALRRPAGDRWRRPLLALALALFVGSFAVALRALPDAENVHPRWALLGLVALVGVPANTVVNAAEYALTARLNGHRATPLQATEVAVLSSAGNLLPIPGAAIVRARGLRKLGASYARAISATAVAGLVWVAVTLVAAGGLLLAADNDGSGLLVPLAAMGGGLAVVAGSAVAIHRLQRTRGGRTGPAVAALVGVEVLAVVVGIGRYAGVMAGLSVDLSLAQAAALTVSVVAASALGFLPGGLGLRELLAAAIAPVVGLPAAVGLLVVAVDRLIGLPVLAAMALGFAVRPPRAVDPG